MGKTLMHDLTHHASDKWEIVATLCVQYATVLSPKGWRTRQGNSGNNSWQMHLTGTGITWYFTGYDTGYVVARNSYFWRNVSEHFALRTRPDVLRFVRHINP